MTENAQSQFKPLPTIFNLRELIERCFEEARQGGYIVVSGGEPVSQVSKNVLVRDPDKTYPIQCQIVANERDLCNHIAMTIIGELRELEVMRKIAPMFRMFNELQRDFAELDVMSAEDFKMRNLRTEPPKEGVV